MITVSADTFLGRVLIVALRRSVAFYPPTSPEEERAANEYEKAATPPTIADPELMIFGALTWDVSPDLRIRNRDVFLGMERGTSLISEMLRSAHSAVESLPDRGPQFTSLGSRIRQIRVARIHEKLADYLHSIDGALGDFLARLVELHLEIGYAPTEAQNAIPSARRNILLAEKIVRENNDLDSAKRTSELSRASPIIKNVESFTNSARAAFDLLANDFGGADLTSAELDGVELAGVRWTDHTQWPSAWAQRVRRSSIEVEPGIFVIQPSRTDTPSMAGSSA